MLACSDAASGWAGSSVNPITTRGADYAHHITARPPIFENPAASLILPFYSEGSLLIHNTVSLHDYFLNFGIKCFLLKHYESLFKSKENVVTETGLHMNRHCVNILGTL